MVLSGTAASIRMYCLECNKYVSTSNDYLCSTRLLYIVTVKLLLYSVRSLLFTHGFSSCGLMEFFLVTVASWALTLSDSDVCKLICENMS